MRGLIMAIPNLIRLLYSLLKDDRIPLLEKAIFVGAVVYLFFPLDIIPDLIPLAGQVDDFLLIALGMQRLFNAAGPELVSTYWVGKPALLKLLQQVLSLVLFFLPPAVKGTPCRANDQDAIDVEYQIKK